MKFRKDEHANKPLYNTQQSYTTVAHCVERDEMASVADGGRGILLTTGLNEFMEMSKDAQLLLFVRFVDQN